jgi:hypothetical protein
LHSGLEIEIEIYTDFFIKKVALYYSPDEAKTWLCQREIDVQDSLSDSLVRVVGMAFANPKLSLDEQIKEAMVYRDNVLITSEENVLVQMKVDRFLKQKTNKIC